MENFECFYCFQQFCIIEKQTWNDVIENDICKLCMEWFDSKQRSIVGKMKELLKTGESLTDHCIKCSGLLTTDEESTCKWCVINMGK